MIRVLLVEDNPTKTKKITAVLTSCGVNISSVVHSSNSLEALREVQAHAFDLLLLDMMIPIRLDEEANATGGLDLLTEITDRDNYIAPRYVIGITQHTDLFETNSETFSNKNFSAIYYDERSDEWVSQLTERVKQIILVENKPSLQPEYKSFAVIICALEVTELGCVLNNGWKWVQTKFSFDDTLYYKTVLIDKKGQEKMIYAASSARMGMPAAAVLSMKLIHHFQPQYIIMPGIMAALRGKANYGDVIVSEMIWDYGSGKVAVEGEGENQASIFLQEPFQIYLDPTVKSHINRIKNDEQLLFEIKRDFKFTKPAESLVLHIGPVASGASVLADSASIKRVQLQHRKLLGIEMEAFAVFLAAQESFHPRPTAICIKSVVDFADTDKDDRFHNYAAYTSSSVVKVLIERYLM
jgi:nucleoside phosphorylase/CheY-like chemotaxis protein